jgi:ABC-type bacteriocin/lantibiotic exporter with double-glycine peptidase domain
VILENELIRKIILFNLFAIVALVMLYRNIDLVMVLISIIFALITIIIIAYKKTWHKKYSRR